MSYWRLFYHFVWGTKKRLPLIKPEFETDLYHVITAKAEELTALVHAVGGVEDHIHLAVSVPPKLALSHFIGQVKGSSSHFVNHVVKPDFEFHWQNEYGVISFGEKQLSFVVRYIHHQRTHHAEGNVQERLERIA
jgi:putative transposase